MFVRLTGCPLRCHYCDTAYAFHGGERIAIDAILAEVAKHGARHVCVTGGEPLAQPECLQLLTRLCDAGYAVSLETSGALPIAQVDQRVIRVVDWKTPASGECHRNLAENIGQLAAQDQVKFVICDRADFDWARLQIDTLGLQRRVGEILFSPSYAQVDAAALAQWILDERVPVRFQLQLHKLLWQDTPGR